MTNTKRQEDILAKHRMMEANFSKLRGEIDKSRQFYALEFEQDVVPAAWQNKLSPFIPPNAQHAIDEAVDHILFTPRVKVMPRPAEGGEALREQDVAEAKRAFLTALWGNETIVHDARKTLINEGMIVIRKILNWHLIPTKPGKGASRAVREKYRREVGRIGMSHEKLWEFEIIDNKTVTYGPVSEHRNPQYVAVKDEITVEDARKLFPRAGDPMDGMGASGNTTDEQSWRSKADLEKVEYIEFWSRDICDERGEVIEPGAFLQFIEGEIVRDEPNPYSYIPIAIEDAGYGIVRNTAEPHDIFVGMTKGMRNTFVAQARQFTAWEAVTELTAFGLYIARNRDPNKVWNVGPGEILDLEGNANEPGAEMFESVKLPEIPNGVIQLVSETNRLANSVLKVETLGGQPLAGVETASEADQQIRNASAKLSSPVGAIERIVEKLSSWVLMDIENQIEAPVTLWATAGSPDDPAYVTVRPSDIRGYYRVSAEMRTTDEEAVNMVKARFWAEMYRVIPFLSAWTAMERGEISDQPAQELVRRASEDVYLSPEMATVRKLVGAQAFGEFAAFIQSLIAGGTAGPGGESASAPATPGAAPSEPLGVLGSSVPAAAPGSAGAARDILQGPSMIRGPRGAPGAQ